MRTKRPRLLTRRMSTFIDERLGAGASLRVGDKVLLSFVSRVRFRDGTRACQSLRVTVTSIRGERHRGEIDYGWTPDPKLFRADELATGAPVTFATENVFLVYR